ncbi:penicillin-binding protein 2 [Novosphingobium sp. TH158]|uniref:peptidoglycan D,D-transpeptidase FtsI family protein n=1 Tax=Novosphingobium sp. TH158 TaxID=2067455 RepID=UPI000C79F9E1|nr:penicillin-binding protein 2 [Novosphingobium sp. TH158]PLK26401.1 peptidoglycan glycosyltransferase [Novosphingobium sp. TH158]
MSAIAVSTKARSGRLQLVNVRQRMLHVAKWRLVFVASGFGALAFAATVRLALLGFGGNAPESLTLDEALQPPRAEIVDRNGVPLARALPTFALWFDARPMDGAPPLVKSPQELATELLRIFPDENYDRLVSVLSSGKSAYIRHRVLPEEADKVQALGEAALQFPREEERFYPQGTMAAFVLGYVDRDGKGMVGMEQVLDQRLKDPAMRGQPVPLSIDARVQGALEDELGKAIAASEAKGGGGIVLDVETGEVLAFASAPSFDPNRPLVYGENGQGLMHNVMTGQNYELGSVFKPLTVAAAIDEGLVTDMAKRWPAGDKMVIAGRPVHDHHSYGASLTVPEALIHSSNIVLAQIGEALGPEKVSGSLKALGFFEKPYLELPGRRNPQLPRDWSNITTTRVAFGHGISLTPLHIASAYAAMVNGGIWRPATLMKIDPDKAPAGRRVFKASTSARMRQLLRLIVSIGTGKSANAAGYRVGGKTGTAEVADQFGYHKDRVVSTFAAAFPMDSPRYVVVTTIVEPKGTAATSGQRTAGYTAAPVVGKVVPRIGPLLGVMPDAERDVDLTDLAPLVANGEGE